MKKKMLYWDEEDCFYREVSELSYPSNKELLAIFPESKSIIPIKINEWEEKKQKVLKKRVKPFLKKIRKIDDEFSRLFCFEGLKLMVGDELGIINKNLFRLRRLQKMIEKPKSNRMSFEENLGEVKSKSLVDIASTVLDLRKVSGKYVALCPFHQEKTPSFYIYPGTNTFYCFGCHKGGDVIEFVKFYYEYDFKKAIEFVKNS